MSQVETVRGPVPASSLGMTLMHEHLFVRDVELAANHPHPEWDEQRCVDLAVNELDRLHDEGIRTVVDLTVLGLGRYLPRVQSVAARTRINLVAATGYYTDDHLPKFFSTHGPGRLVGGPEPLEQFFLDDIRVGIAGTGVKAGAIKVVSDRPGITEDVARVFRAAAVVHRETGVPILTHTNAEARSGDAQQELFTSLGVPPERVVIGHCGDSTDLAYLRRLMDNGSTIGLDRFGMEHVLDDETRIELLLQLLGLGYANRMVLSQDAAFFSQVTPPSWRAVNAPHWNHHDITDRVLPALRHRGVDEVTIRQLMVANPARLLTRS